MLALIAAGANVNLTAESPDATAAHECENQQDKNKNDNANRRLQKEANFTLDFGMLLELVDLVDDVAARRDAIGNVRIHYAIYYALKEFRSIAVFFIFSQKVLDGRLISSANESFGERCGLTRWHQQCTHRKQCKRCKNQFT